MAPQVGLEVGDNNVCRYVQFRNVQGLKRAVTFTQKNAHCTCSRRTGVSSLKSSQIQLAVVVEVPFCQRDRIRQPSGGGKYWNSVFSAIAVVAVIILSARIRIERLVFKTVFASLAHSVVTLAG